jgi:hypothetical protein
MEEYKLQETIQNKIEACCSRDENTVCVFLLCYVRYFDCLSSILRSTPKEVVQENHWNHLKPTPF